MEDKLSLCQYEVYVKGNAFRVVMFSDISNIYCYDAYPTEDDFEIDENKIKNFKPSVWYKMKKCCLIQKQIFDLKKNCWKLCRMYLNFFQILPEINRTNVRILLYIFCVLWYTKFLRKA